ncbi:hypothetical protein [Streptomyces sp. NPDC059142]|uniref:hypothetical protein n=1 Tax=unclassified Streptomyces TaxID=2593676 RepID=UPI0036B85E37
MALSTGIFFALFFWVLSDDEEPDSFLFAAIIGLLLGLVLGFFTVVPERLRQRRLKRLGIWDGS